MIEVQHTLLSDDIFEKKFVCNLSKCKGICCVEGDSGAPLEKEEVEILEKIYPKIEPFLREEGKEAIRKQGTSVVDIDGEEVTPLINHKECAYVVFDENLTALCGIELAYLAGKVDFIKPISCHLYPIRVTRYKNFEALNYDKWSVCSPACDLGETLQISVLDFLEKPLKRKYGDAWFKECSEIQKILYRS